MGGSVIFRVAKVAGPKNVQKGGAQSPGFGAPPRAVLLDRLEESFPTWAPLPKIPKPQPYFGAGSRGIALRSGAWSVECWAGGVARASMPAGERGQSVPQAPIEGLSLGRALLAPWPVRDSRCVAVGV